MFYKNAMQAVWLDYTTKYLIKQDINLVENYEDDDEFFDTNTKKE
jgi:hypothetical protein